MTADPPIVFAFRNDDPSARSDVEHERRVAALFERYGVRQTLGVIPEITAGEIRDPRATGAVPLEPDSPVARFLRDYAARSGSEIAMHGLTHRTSPHSSPARREYFEFGRRSVADEARMIARGTAILDAAFGSRPTTFVPPWNRFDRNTLAACVQEGYRVLSAGAYSGEMADLAACGTDCDLAGMPKALATLKAAGRGGVLKILYHSRSIRTEAEWNALEHAVRTAANEPGREILTIAELALRDPLRTRTINRAARAAERIPTPDRTARGRVAVYQTVLGGRGPARRVNRLRQDACAAYATGDYGRGARIGEDLDARSERLVLGARVLISIAAFTAASALGFSLGSPFARYASAAVAPLAAAAAAAVRGAATSTQIRREITVAGACAAAGALCGAGVVLLSR